MFMTLCNLCLPTPSIATPAIGVGGRVGVVLPYGSLGNFAGTGALLGARLERYGDRYSVGGAADIHVFREKKDEFFSGLDRDTHVVSLELHCRRYFRDRRFVSGSTGVYRHVLSANGMGTNVKFVEWSMGVGLAIGMCRPSRLTALVVGFDILFEDGRSYVVRVAVERLIRLR